MDQEVNTIENYSTANEDQRIFMFLAYPELRERFMAIDIAQKQSSTTVLPESSTRFKDNHRFNRLVSISRKWLKLCCPTR